MDSSLNVSFKAKIDLSRVKGRVKDKKVVDYLEKNFPLATSRYNNETLYLTPYSDSGFADEMLSVHLSEKKSEKSNKFFACPEIFTDNLNKQSKKNTPKQMLKKAVTWFRALKAREEFDAKNLEYNEKIDSLKKSYKQYRQRAIAARNFGRIDMADFLDVVITKKMSQIQETLNKQKAYKQKYDAKMQQFYEVDPVVIQIANR